MKTKPLNDTFDPQTLADDLLEIRRIYIQFFAGLDETDWDKPVKGSPKEWNLHETVAHLCALNGAGLESIQHTLRGEPYTFTGLEDRYQLKAYNRAGIDAHLGIPMKALCDEHLDILYEAARIARNLQPGEAERTSHMPIFNRPVSIVEALSIISFHAGLVHATQVAEPAGVPPLWMQLSAEIRHRLIGRMMRAMSLRYRIDLGRALRDTIAFRIDGPGGGEWYVALSPDAPNSGEGVFEHPGLMIHMRDTAVFARMMTSRINLPLALVRGNIKLRGNLRLFLQMGDLFSEDARPNTATQKGSSLYKPSSS